MPAKTLLRRLDSGPPRLNRAMERMIDLMLDGDPMEQPHEPMDPYSAGKASGYHRKAVRELLGTPAFIAAFEEKRRLYQRDGYLTTMLPTVEHIRDQIRWQAERTALIEELRVARQALDDKRREMVEHYNHCPKNPKRPAAGGYEILLEEAAE
jgi:hypothetical protein